MNKVKISFVLNLLIVLFVSLGCIFMFSNIHFMPQDNVLQSSNIQIFKYYTVDSNILVGFVSLLLFVYEFLYLKEKKEIPNHIYYMKFIGTSSLILTFFVTLFFLAPRYGYYTMYNNSNLFFHLIVPLLSFISYIFFEKHRIQYKYTFLGILPMLSYSIYYGFSIMKYGVEADFYGFLQGNMNHIYFIFPFLIFVSYFSSWCLLCFNKKV